MDIDAPGWPLIDDFFEQLAEGRAAPTVHRYGRVRHRLYDFLDTGDMTLGLGTHPATLLEAERQFHESGAFWSLLGPGELVCCLPSFLHETWLPDGSAEARTQISIVGRLLTHLGRRHDIDWAATQCALWDAQAAVAQARRDLTARPTVAPEDHSMPARFARRPGPRW